MHTSYFIRIAFIVLLAMGLWGCGKGELDRSAATDLLQNNEKIKALSLRVPLHQGAIRQAGELDILDKKGALTPKGAKLFSKFEYGEATLVQPLPPPIIEVTGIASVPMSEDMKVAQFNLASRYTPAIKRFAAKTGKSEAIFRRYDDGWRLEKVEIATSSEAYPLTAQERGEVDAEAAAVAAEKAKFIEELEKKVAASRVGSQVLFQNMSGDVVYKYASEHVVHNLTLMDTEIYVGYHPGSWGAPGGALSIWFGDIVATPLACKLQKQDRGWRGREHIYQDIFVWEMKRKGGAQFSLVFSAEEKCGEFNTKFYEAYTNWRNEYWGAISSLAELH